MKTISILNYADKNFKKLAFFQTLIILISVVSVIFICRHYFNVSFFDQTENQLKNNLHTYGSLVQKISLDDICSSHQNLKYNRLTVVNSLGEVICDSSYDVKKMDNHINRKEIEDAKENGWGASVRYSETLKMDMFYGSLKVKYKSEYVYLRQSVVFSKLDETLTSIDKSIYIIVFPILLLLSFISLWFNLFYQSKEEKKVAKLKEDLVSNISHDVRTPLTAIKGYVQIILSQKDNSQFDTSSFFERIDENVGRLDDLFASILNLTQIENEKNISSEEVELNSIINRTVDNLLIKYKNKNIIVNMDYANAGNIYSNNFLIENILSNVIENAFKYNVENGTIQIESYIRNEKAFFSIEDSGIGITSDCIPHVFERFYCVDKSRSGSTGLGLAISKHAVLKLKGDIWLDSSEGKGSTFFLTIPSDVSLSTK